MFRFWYHFVQKNINLINMELGEIVYSKQIESKINDYMGSVFEKIVLEYYELRLRKGMTEFIPSDYGNWWGNDKNRKKESEIDLLSYDEEGNYLFAEVKWKNQKADKSVFDELIEKSKNFNCFSKAFWIVSLSGFEKFKKNEDVELIDISDVYKL